MVVDPTPTPVLLGTLANDTTFEIGGQYCVTCTGITAPVGERAIFNLSASNAGTMAESALVTVIPLKVVHA